MTDLNRTPSFNCNELPPRVAVAPRSPMVTTGPLFSNLDVIAGMFAALMTLGPLAMAAFAVGRY
jgi:hypothetical protein